MKKVIINSRHKALSLNGNALYIYGRELPAGYTEVEYIENPSNAYLNTGITPPAVLPELVAQGDSSISTSAILVGSKTSAGHWFGARTDGYWGNGGASLSRPVTTKSTLKVSIAVNSITFGIHGGTEYTVNAETNISTAIWLFRASQTGSSYYPFAGKVFGDLVITKSGVEVFHGIPCINPSNVAGWYDIVSDSFKSSASSTQFTAGPAVSSS